jgi:hypothetical protein
MLSRKQHQCLYVVLVNLTQKSIRKGSAEAIQVRAHQQGQNEFAERDSGSVNLLFSACISRKYVVAQGTRHGLASPQAKSDPGTENIS